MPPPVEAADTCTASRTQIALYYLGRARRRLIDAKPYLADTDAGRNFDGLIAALESRIDRIRLHGVGPIDADAPLIAYGVDGGSSPVDAEEIRW